MSDVEMRDRAIESLVDERRSGILLAGYALACVVLIVIWGATGAGYFWPVWPILAGLVAYCVVSLARGWSNREFSETTVRQREAHLAGQAPPGIQR
jgi:phosphate/sulfate permease